MLGLTYASNFEMTFIFRKIDTTYEWQKNPNLYEAKSPPTPLSGFNIWVCRLRWLKYLFNRFRVEWIFLVFGTER